MKRSKLIIGLMFSLLAVMLMGQFYADWFKVSVNDAVVGSLVVSTGITVLHVVGIMITGRMPYDRGIAMDVAVEFWQNLIIENLFKDNNFLLRSHAVGQEYILGGKVVHIPQAGAKPGVTKNRAVFPAAAVRRADSDITYALDDYTTDPTHIPNIEQAEISYQKAVSVLMEHGLTMDDLIADEFLYKWGAGLALASYVRTTGTLDAAFLPNATATGQRRKFTKEDVKKARFILNKQNINKGKRVMLLPSEFYDQLMDDATLLTRDTAKEVDIKNGVVIRLYGFDLMERSDVLMADNTDTPVIKAVGAAEAATDNLTALAWQESAVERAVGTVKFFENKDDATYYGDVYSSEIRAGGRRRRENAEGVVAITQAAV